MTISFDRAGSQKNCDHEEKCENLIHQVLKNIENKFHLYLCSL